MTRTRHWTAPVLLCRRLLLFAAITSGTGVFARGLAAGPPPTSHLETGDNDLEIRLDVGCRYSTPLLGIQLDLVPGTPGRNDLVVDLSRIDWRIIDAAGRDVAPRAIAERKSPDWFNPSADGSMGRIIALEPSSWKGGKIQVGGKSWHLSPGKYTLEAVLDTSADRPGRIGGDHQPLREIWIGKLRLPRMPFEVIGEVSDEALDAAADKVHAVHSAGGVAMWRALAKLVRPGMTVHQLQLALPPLKPAADKHTFGDYTEVVWMGTSFFMRYPLDKVWEVRASGHAIAAGAVHGDSRAAVVSQPPRIMTRAEGN